MHQHTSSLAIWNHLCCFMLLYHLFFHYRTFYCIIEQECIGSLHIAALKQGTTQQVWFHGSRWCALWHLPHSFRRLNTLFTNGILISLVFICESVKSLNVSTAVYKLFLHYWETVKYNVYALWCFIFSSSAAGYKSVYLTKFYGFINTDCTVVLR